jgi:acetyl-CoA carboxylase carboxyl transferase subunit alpha
MAKTWKEWEQPVLELEQMIERLERAAQRESDPAKRGAAEEKVQELKQRRDTYVQLRYSRLTPWEEVLLARAETRPYTLDYVGTVFTDFTELEGDRRYGSDRAMVGGPAFLDGRPVMVVGQQKGRNLQERTFRNFAMSKPEGYRKAIRLFEMADRFRMPVVTLVDTPAADPGVESEGRGIAEAIAASMLAMFGLRVPVVSVLIGEGGSGGAIAIAVANKVLMMEHAIYSVIPPEGCAAILWRDPSKGPEAAAALGLTSASALELGIVDKVLPEPFGGAHRNFSEAAATVKAGILEALAELDPMSPEEIKRHRYDRFRKAGRFEDASRAAVR